MDLVISGARELSFSLRAPEPMAVTITTSLNDGRDYRGGLERQVDDLRQRYGVLREA